MRTSYIPLVIIISLALVSAVFAQNWQHLYDQALRDLEAARWESAVAKLQEAVRQQPVSGQAITGEQGQTLRYFPYYLLGKAHFHLGRYTEAARFFAREAGQPVLPMKLVQDIERYQRQIQTALTRKKEADFRGALQQAEAARLKGAFAEAVAALERARQLDGSEFKARRLDSLLASLQESEKKLAEENRFRLLVKQAEEKEKQNSLQEASSTLDEADRLIPGRVEVGQIRARIKKREETYTRLKEAAATDEKEGRLSAAAEKLRQADQADPQRFIADNLPPKLAQLDARISGEAEIQQFLRSGAGALRNRDYGQAIVFYDRVLEKDPTNRVAVEQKRRAEALKLVDQAQNFIEDGAFTDALAALSLSYDLEPSNGELIYEKMRPHVNAFSRRQDGLRREWLNLMRAADASRFRRENPGASAAAQRPRQQQRQPAAKPRLNEEREDEQQRKAVLAAIQGPPQEAVKLLEKVRATRGKSNAELESWTGVAYARLSLLTSDPEERKRLHAKASEHFRLSLKMDPQHELDPRLVAPHIQEIFSEAKSEE